MMNGRLQEFLYILVCMLIMIRTEEFLVDITYVQSAVAKGAGKTLRCSECCGKRSRQNIKDGSPPAYHFDRGSRAGINNWLVHIEGGGWCNNVTTCLERKDNCLGSFKKMAKQVVFSGILSNKIEFNPGLLKNYSKAFPVN
ncbi:pectin acetylesterase 8-like isoform X2 [Olea europaea var. sylvestris]|uniref:Pectin acetylesterase n=2 Tax=Olea europaea subsp. europaea TaxID=158383 RepID=A0A8S0TFR0_OLEEU|nr:pectin acetylesterase 8-like isoform X2 [Olea europaea var. sylvestris]CAA3004144.1 pectin acetylesterase 8-like isoform X3 [Olea europaea subsp. europaea]